MLNSEEFIKRLETSPMERFVKGGAWATFIKVLAALTGFLLNLVLVRLLSPSDLGAYFLIISLLAAASTISTIGMPQAIVRFITETLVKGCIDRVVAIIRSALLYTGGVSFVLTIALVFGLSGFILSKIDGIESFMLPGVIIGVWMMSSAWQTIIAESFRGLHMVGLASIFIGPILTLFSLIVFSLILFFSDGMGLQGVIKITVFNQVLVTILGLVLIYRFISPVKCAHKWVEKDLLMMSLPLWVTNIGLYILMQLDLWIVGVALDTDAVAVYGASARLVMLVATPLLIINAVVPPLIAELYVKNKDKDLQHLLQATATMVAIPSIIAVMVFLFWGEAVLGLLYGPVYIEGASVLVILSIGQLVNIWSGSCGLTLMLTNQQKAMMYITILSGLINIILAISLVSKIGILGVAVAAMISLSFQNIAMLLKVRQSIGIWTNISFSSMAGTIPMVRKIWLGYEKQN